jgi:hypothetical protein
MQENKKPNIGEIICLYLKKNGITKKWLAQNIGSDYPNFCKQLKNPSLDAYLIARISLLLNHDFFAYFSLYVRKNSKKTP